MEIDVSRPTDLAMRISLRLKLLASSLVLVALCAVGFILAIGRLGDVKASGHELHDRAYLPTVAAVGGQATMKDLQIQTMTFTELSARLGPAKTLASPQGKALVKRIDVDQRQLSAIAKALGTVTGPERAIAQRFIAATAQYNQAMNAIGKIKPEEFQTAKGLKLSKQIEDAGTVIDRSAQELSVAGNKLAEAKNQKIDDAYSTGRTAILVSLIVAILVGLAISLRIAAVIRRDVAGIRRGLRHLREHDTASLRTGLDAVAGGDLTVRAEATTEPVVVHSRDEVGDVAAMVEEIRRDTVASIDAYNASLDGLGAMIGRVSRSATTLGEASEQMASTSRETGRAVDEIASAVEDVATGAERQVNAVAGARRLTDDMTAASESSARTADDTARAAEAARELAGEGAQAVADATEAMVAVREASSEVTEVIRGLGAKSEQIGGIVDAITGIAEQTNLLALNAAIEAARAGEQGRGFAVVAEEVRKLAEESQHAAASIAGLIGEIQHETARAVDVVESGAARTDEGTKTVEHARAAFERIAGQVDEMSARVADIAVAVGDLAQTSERMREEVNAVASVSEQTSAATEQVSASTQQTSAATQQIAASAETLAATAGELTRLVGEFRL